MQKNITKHSHTTSKNEREEIKNQKSCILWFTGLSGSGKSTLANALEAQLLALNKHTYLLDGDNIRMGLNSDLGFCDEDRVENIRRVGEVSKLFVEAGVIVLTAFISPFRKERQSVRALVDRDEFIEIFIDTPLEVCEKRDPKGLYQKARNGEIAHFTGISSPYEPPINPQIRIINDTISIEEGTKMIIDYLYTKGYLDSFR